MYLLAIDTSTEACTVALQVGTNGERIEKSIPQRQHAERLIELVESVLAEAGCSLVQMDALVWARGPGMFTGLRIGAGVVQGLAYAVDRPVVCVSTLAVLAKAQTASHVLAAIDARMGQVYWAAFENSDDGSNSFPVSLNDEQVDDPESVEVSTDGPWLGVGSGWDQYHDTLSATLGSKLERWIPQQYPSGHALLDLGVAGFNAGDAMPASEAVPVYIRDSVAKKQGER